jgi:hypothetical protein
MKTINLIILIIKQVWPSVKYLIKAVAPIL